MKTFLAFLLALAPLAASAQAYPSKPVKILVPAQPGGGLDLIGRTVADQLSRALDQSFIVENSAGAGGTIAAQTAARAAPDGYTLMVGYVGTHGTNPAVRKLPYDAIKDFTPIAMVGGTPNLLVVTPMADMLGGQIHVLMPGLAAALPHIRAGKLKPLAITGLQRHPLVPDLPTFEESGFKGFDGVQWYGIVGPAKLPSEITRKLNGEINKAIQSPALQQRLASEAINVMPMSPEQFGQFIQADIARWSALARERNIHLDD